MFLNINNKLLHLFGSDEIWNENLRKGLKVEIFCEIWMIFISFIKDTSADISKTVFGKVFFMWQSMLIFSFRGYTLRKNFKKLGNWRQIYEQKSSTFYTSNNVPKGGLMGLYDEIFLSRPWNFYFKRKVLKYFRKRNACREILFSFFKQSSFIHTIMITLRS